MNANHRHFDTSGTSPSPTDAADDTGQRHADTYAICADRGDRTCSVVEAWDVPGEAILDAMRKQGRTRRQVYMFLGVDKSTFSRWVNGEIDPPVSKAIQLAVLLNRPVEELFEHLAWGRGKSA